MIRSEAYPSRNLNQDDVRAGPVRATIADVRIETFGRSEDADEKPVIHFREAGMKTFGLNQTNWDVLESAYGKHTEEWIGKPVELYHDPGVKFGRETVGGVRIRVPSGAPAASPQGSAEGALPLDQALVEAAKLGMGREAFLDALRAKGLTKGYSPTRDAGTARTILSAAAAAMDDTIPF